MPVTKSTEDWMDSFWMTVEVSAELLNNKAKMEDMARSKLEGKLFDQEAYKSRKSIWKRVRAKFIKFGLEACDDLTFTGAQRDNKGDWRAVGDLYVYHTEDSQTPVVFKGDEAQMAMNFISFFLTSLTRGVKPETYVKSVLANQGIMNAEDFDKHKDKFLIQNPWRPE